MTEPDKMTDPVERARYWKLRALAAEGRVKASANSVDVVFYDGQPARFVWAGEVVRLLERVVVEVGRTITPELRAAIEQYLAACPSAAPPADDENARLLAANRDLKLHFDTLKSDYDEAVRLLETSKTVLTIALMLAKEAAKHLPASAPIDMAEARVKLGLVMLHIDAIDACLAKAGK